MVTSKVLQAFLADTRQAIGIWVALLLVIGGAFVVYTVNSRLKEIAAFRQRIAIRRISLTVQATELRECANEMQVAASRAAATAERRHEEWQAAQRAVEAAWRAYDKADRDARDASRAMAFASAPEAPAVEALTEDELASRERYLRRIAAEAYHRGALSIEQLADVSMHRNGWDPAMHPADLDARLRQIARARLQQVYGSALAVERAAWRDSVVAAAAKRSLAEEAQVAELSAEAVERELAALATMRFSDRAREGEGSKGRDVAKGADVAKGGRDAAKGRDTVTIPAWVTASSGGGVPAEAADRPANIRQLRPVRVREVLVGPAAATVQMPRIAA